MREHSAKLMAHATAARTTYSTASASRTGSDIDRMESRHAHTATIPADNTPATAACLAFFVSSRVIAVRLLIRNRAAAVCSAGSRSEEKKTDGGADESH